MFWFSLKPLSEKKNSHSKKNWVRHDQKRMLVFTQSTSYSCPVLMELKFSRQIFAKYPNIKFHENPTSGRRVVTCGQTDMEQLIVPLRNFPNAPKTWRSWSHEAASSIIPWCPACSVVPALTHRSSPPAPHDSAFDVRSLKYLTNLLTLRYGN